MRCLAQAAWSTGERNCFGLKQKQLVQVVYCGVDKGGVFGMALENHDEDRVLFWGARHLAMSLWHRSSRPCCSLGVAASPCTSAKNT